MRLKDNILLFFVYIFSVFIDLFNGYIQQVHDSNSFIPILFKGGVILYLIRYVLKLSNVVAKYTRLLLIFYFISLGYWIGAGYYSIPSYEINLILKFVYPYFVLSYLMYKYKSPVDLLYKYPIFYAVIGAISIYMAFFWGMGVGAYGGVDNAYGFGVKGFFKATNDTGIMLLICSCFTCYLYSITRKKRYLLILILLSFSTMLIGSVAGTMGSILIFNLFFISLFFRFRDVKFSFRIKFVLSIIYAIVLFSAISIAVYIITYDEYMLKKYGSITALLFEDHARAPMTETAQKIFDSFSFLDYIFGQGYSAFHLFFGKSYAGLNIPTLVEKDVYDLLGGYGLLLGGNLLLFPCLILFISVKKLFQYRSVELYWSTIGLCLYIFHGIYAGHAFGSVISSTFVVIIYYMVLKYRRIVL